MSSKTLISVLIAVIVLGGGYMVLQSKNTENEEVRTDVVGDNGPTGNNAKQSNETEETAVPNGKKMAFSEFLKQGGAHKCTVNQYIGDIETKGTTYISGDMIRGEYSMNMQGMDMTSTFIVRDGYTYSWSSMMPNMGFKSKVVASQSTTDTSVEAHGTYSWNAEQIGDYNCEVWASDASLFVIPKGISFTETN